MNPRPSGRGLALSVVAAALALAAALLPATTSAALGDYIGSFNLVSDNSHPNGITQSGSYLRVLDGYDKKIYTYDADGDHVSASDFNLHLYNGAAAGITRAGNYLYVAGKTNSRVYKYTTGGSSTGFFTVATANADPAGITWDSSYLRVLDSVDDKVYTYTTGGTHSSAQDFTLATANSNPVGITWDGVFLRVVDNGNDKVYTYDKDGTYYSDQDFDLANDYPSGIAWDGSYLRVADYNDDAVDTYEGLPVGPFTNEGVPDTIQLGDLAAASITTIDGWKCAGSSSGVDVAVNNVNATIHGFCARESGAAGMEVEVHLASTSEYADLHALAEATGEWYFSRSGDLVGIDYRIYDDSATTDGDIAFTESAGGLVDSNRLGFATKAKAVIDTDCQETSGGGFACSLTFFQWLSDGDTGVLVFALTDENTIGAADTPSSPESVTASRSEDYGTTTLAWTLYDAVTRYEIERLTAVQVSVVDASRIEYGDPVTFTITGTQAGVSSYVDSTVQAHRTYQYRLRARGAGGDAWSDWSAFIYSGARPKVDIPKPGNFVLTRDSDSIVASWSAPTGDFDNYTLQRQDLLVVEGSTFFANIVTLAPDGEDWIPGADTTYTDSSILPAQTYEYRVAAVKDDQVGAYTDWFRVGPILTTLGAAPLNFHRDESRDTTRDDRGEFWMDWDDVPGADDYEVQVLVYEVSTGRQSMKVRYVSDSTYFETAYGRVEIRVRGRKLDADLCAGAADDRCLTEWTSWNVVRFTPTVTTEAPPMVDASADASLMGLRAETAAVISSVFDPAGTTVDTSLVLQLGVITLALVAGGVSIALGWRRGMAPLGVGMGVAITILILFVGYRLFGTPVAWPVAAQAAVAVAGIFAVVRQTGGVQINERGATPPRPFNCTGVVVEDRPG